MKKKTVFFSHPKNSQILGSTRAKKAFALGSVHDILTKRPVYSIKFIAKQLGMPSGQVAAILRSFGLRKNNSISEKTRELAWRASEIAKKNNPANGMAFSLREIAKMLNVSHQEIKFLLEQSHTLKPAAKNLGFSSWQRKPLSERIAAEKLALSLAGNYDSLFKRYLFSGAEISKKTGIPLNRVEVLLREFFKKPRRTVIPRKTLETVRLGSVTGIKSKKPVFSLSEIEKKTGKQKANISKTLANHGLRRQKRKKNS